MEAACASSALLSEELCKELRATISFLGGQESKLRAALATLKESQ